MTRCEYHIGGSCLHLNPKQVAPNNLTDCLLNATWIADFTTPLPTKLSLKFPSRNLPPRHLGKQTYRCRVRLPWLRRQRRILFNRHWRLFLLVVTATCDYSEEPSLDSCLNIRHALNIRHGLCSEHEFSLLTKKDNAHEDSIWSCAWGRQREDVNSSKGDRSPVEYIATGGVDDIVKIWNFRNDRLELRHKLSGHSLGVVSVAINNEGTTCASSSLDSSLRLWDLASGEKVGSIDVGPVDIWTVAFSPDDKYIISGSHSGKINLYGVESGVEKQNLDTRGKFMLSIAYSPDGKYIASGAIDGIISIFDVASGKLVHTLEGHAMPIRSLCFSPNSQLLLTASDDGHMKLYDVQHADVAGTVSGHASWVLDVSFSPDNKHFVSSSADKTVRVWELAQRKCLHTFKEHTDQVWGVKFSPGGDKVVSVSEDRSVNIYATPV